MPTQDRERLVDAFSTHWIKYAMPVFVSVVLLLTSAFLIYVSGLSAHHIMWLSHITLLLALVLLLMAHHWFFHRVLSDGMDDVIITDRRIIFLDSSLWFRDDMQEIALAQIRAVEARKRGILQNIFHYGSLWFDTGGSAIGGGKVIPLVPHPHRKAKEILALLKMS